MFRWFVLWEFFLIFIYIISLVYFLRRWEIVGVNLFIEFGYWILFIYVLIDSWIGNVFVWNNKKYCK